MNFNKAYAEHIAKEYAPKETSKIKALMRLDNKAKLPAIIVGFAFGLLSALIFSVGLCLNLGVFGNISNGIFILAILIGFIGIAGMSVNYFIYKKLLEKGKQKYGQDIITLAKQIIDEEE